jgi:hypothetical protein
MWFAATRIAQVGGHQMVPNLDDFHRREEKIDPETNFYPVKSSARLMEVSTSRVPLQ